MEYLAIKLQFAGGSPTYLLEHLATFTVSPENDLVYPADGMRRLLAMEKTSGIWTQKVRRVLLSPTF
jgi:epidermal growth factor receptor kinase substrate 8